MIKNFNTYINEDYFSKLANRRDTGEVRKENELTEDVVRSFVQSGYEKLVKSITIRKENGKTIVDIDGSFFLRNDVEQIPFQFGTITGHFDCSGNKLKTLEGCPKEVGGDFSCSCCNNLTSLEGCPKYVGGSLICNTCMNLTSLEGCPKIVGGSFSCRYCHKQFTKEKVQSLCKVKKGIFV